MRVLVGIPSFRRPALLEGLLDSLERQEGVDAVDVRVFIADNDASRREAAALCEARAPTFRFALGCAVVPFSGIAAARNRLLAEARMQNADVLAMIDDDEVASPRWLAGLVAVLLDGADVVGGPVRYRFARPPGAAVLGSGAFAANAKRAPDGALNATGNLALRCAALAEAGWPAFDDAFGLTGGEDKEFLTRLRRLGLRFAWADRAQVVEVVPARRLGSGAIFNRAMAIGASDYRIAQRHGRRSERAVHLVKSVAVLAAAVPLAPMLLLPRWRLWLLRRIARAAGRIGASLGLSRAYYGAAVSP